MIQINTLEEFKDVQDYYYVEGDVIYSKARGELKPLKPSKVDGYQHVKLRTKQNTTKGCSVHRIIATAYIPNPDNKPTVNHINHNRADNRPENLEWATKAEQCNNTVRQKHQKPVLLIDEQTGYSMTFLSQTQCAKYLGVRIPTVNKAIKTGGRCKGYKLKKIGKKRY